MRKIRYKEVSPEIKRMAEPNFGVSGRSSLGMEQFMGEYFFIDVEKLIPYRQQARKLFNEEEIEKLAETIRVHGVRQPLTVLRLPEQEGVFEVVSGERRLRAAKLAGLKKVPCIIIEDADQAAEIALVENIQRENLHPIEFAKAVHNLILSGAHGNQSEVARKIGISRSHLSETLKILDLPPALLDKMLKHDVRGREHFRKLGTMGTEQEQNQYLNKVLKINEDTPLQKSLVARSVLRISVGEDGVKVQKSRLKDLTEIQRKEIIQTLEEIVQEWR